MVQMLCSNCNLMSEVKVETRATKPMDEPDYPVNFGHWEMADYILRLKSYEMDHWNRTVVCGECGHAQHYWKEDRDGKANKT